MSVPAKIISSRDNATFKSLKKLAHSARERKKTDQVLLDGAHLIEAHAACLGAPEMLVLSDGSRDKAENRALLARFPKIPSLAMSDVLFRELSPVETPSGLLALAARPRLALPGQARFAVFLDAVQDPGNLGSILRSAAAAGVDAAYLSAGCADAWSPRVLRGGMGAHFTLPLREGADLAALAAGFSGEVMVTSLEAEASVFDLDLTGPIALVIGNEGSGVSPALQAAATRLARIPMPGAVESLNVAAAAAICLFERVRQLKSAGGRKS